MRNARNQWLWSLYMSFALDIWKKTSIFWLLVIFVICLSIINELVLNIIVAFLVRKSASTNDNGYAKLSAGGTAKHATMVLRT